MQRTTWIAAFTLFATFSVGVWLAEVRHEYVREEREVETATTVTARLLKEHAARALEAGDLILMLMTDMAHNGDLVAERHAEAMARLKKLVDDSPQVGAAWFLDAEGDILFDSWSFPPKPANYAYRDYFQVHKAGLRDTFVGPAELGSTGGRRRFTLSRPILRDGAFAGVAVANVRTAYFADFFRQSQLGKGASIRLVTLNGETLADWNDGGTLPAGAIEKVYAAADAAEEGLLRVGDGDDATIVSFRLLDNHPVLVLAARPLEPALAPWRERSLRSGLAVAAALVGFALLMLMGLGTARRERLVRAALETARASLEREVDIRSAEAQRRKNDLRLIADALPALIAYVDRDGRYSFVNKTYSTWFGRDPDDIIGMTPESLLGGDLDADVKLRHEAARAGRSMTCDTVVPMPDGQTREIEARYIPSSGPEGEEGGFYVFVVDVTARRAAERALRDSEQRYRNLFEAMDQGFAIHEMTPGDNDYRFVQVNPAFERLTGLVAEDVVGRTAREILPALDDAFIARFAGVVRSGQSVRIEEMVAPLGRWYDIYAFSLGPGRFATLFDDVTERKQDEERQALLMAELDHRVRNILASVQSMVLLTARSASTKEQYAEILRGRVAAMARAHGLLTQCGWRGARLDQIVRDELAPYAGHSGGVTIDGPGDCMLKPKDALNFALVLHELATNAAKYGALSLPEGKVAVRWTVEESGPLNLVWQESGGPRVQAPDRRGFGSVLIESALGGDGATSVDLTFPPEGVRCAIALPRQRLVDRRSEAAPPQPAPPPAPAIPGAQGSGTPARPPSARMHAPSVLMVEDELLVAVETANALKLAGFTIVGPATTVGAGLTMAAHEAFDVAVLDVNLNGRLSTPIADVLIERGIPFVLASGYDIKTVLPPHLHGVPALQKPVDTALLAARLRRLIQDGPAPRAGEAATPPLTPHPAAQQS